MASLNKEPNGSYTVQLVGGDGKRRSLRLGKVPKKSADSIKLRIESLHACAVAGLPWDADLAAWTATLGDDLAVKLAGLGLMPARQEAVTLARLLDLYAESAGRSAKPGTMTNHRTVANDLLGHFKPSTPARSVTPEDAQAFLDALKARGLRPATLARRLRRVRTVFAFAVKKKWIDANPFCEVKTPDGVGGDRKHYISVNDAARMFDAAAPVWRTILALCRFGGLRCPSEVLMLRWSDVDLAGGRMLIPVEKLAHIPGRGTRECPVFAALRPHLEEAFELAAPGEVYVVGGVTGDTHRRASRRPGGWVNANLRTTFSKIVHRAGLKQWPRLFQNLRASCETDLLSEYPIASVTAWIGHSAEVALKHYSQVRSADFDRAAGREKPVQNPVQSAAKVVQNAVQSGNDLSELEPTFRAETPGNVGPSSLKCRPVLGSADQRGDPAGIRRSRREAYESWRFH